MPARLQLRRILVPLDGSDLAEAILPVVARLARDHEAEVVLLEVLAGQRTREAEHEVERQAGGYLEQAVASLRGHGLRRVQRRVWYGEADQAIANATAREQADLVAMSTHGRSGLDRLRFGSVAESVVRRAPVPVLLVRGIAAWDRGGIDRILVPARRVGGLGGGAPDRLVPGWALRLRGPPPARRRGHPVAPGLPGRGEGWPRFGDRGRVPRAGGRASRGPRPPRRHDRAGGASRRGRSRPSPPRRSVAWSRCRPTADRAWAGYSWGASPSAC